MTGVEWSCWPITHQDAEKIQIQGIKSRPAYQFNLFSTFAFNKHSFCGFQPGCTPLFCWFFFRLFGVVYCIPCRRSGFSRDLTQGCKGLLNTSSGSVSCSQPRWLLLHFNRLRFWTYLDERKTQGRFHAPAHIAQPVLLCTLSLRAGWDAR